jgi:hypothetical protein
MSECRQCHGTGYMTVRDGTTERIKPCNLCLVGSARYWEERQKAADERKERRKLVEIDQFGGGQAE